MQVVVEGDTQRKFILYIPIGTAKYCFFKFGDLKLPRLHNFDVMAALAKPPRTDPIVFLSFSCLVNREKKHDRLILLVIWLSASGKTYFVLLNEATS